MNKIATILLTGGTGFLGSFVLRTLVKNNFHVILLKRFSSDTSRIDDLLLNTENKITVVNIGTDMGVSVFDNFDIDYVIHTATCYGRNNESEADIIESNLIFPLCLLRKAKVKKIKGFINTDTFFTTAIGLENGEKLYVKTKKDFLYEAKNEIIGFKLKFISLKLQQVYGPADNPNKFIPMIIKKLKTDDKIPLTLGAQKRDFIYVEDVANAFLATIINFDKLNQIEEFDIGSGMSYTIKKVVKLLAKSLNSHSRLLWGALPYRSNEIMMACATATANKKIGWRANFGLQEGLEKVVSYYNTVYEKFL